MTNNQVREEFKEYLEKNFNPSLVKLHKAIGVGYSDLCSWINGKHEYGQRNLTKIKAFLNARKGEN